MDELNSKQNKVKTYQFYATAWEAGFKKGIHSVLLFLIFFIIFTVPIIGFFESKIISPQSTLSRFIFKIRFYVSFTISFLITKHIVGKRRMDNYHVSIKNTLMTVKKNGDIDFKCSLNHIKKLETIDLPNTNHFKFETKNQEKYSFSQTVVTMKAASLIWGSLTKDNFLVLQALKKEIIKVAFSGIVPKKVTSLKYRFLYSYEK